MTKFFSVLFALLVVVFSNSALAEDHYVGLSPTQCVYRYQTFADAQNPHSNVDTPAMYLYSAGQSLYCPLPSKWAGDYSDHEWECNIYNASSVVVKHYISSSCIVGVRVCSITWGGSIGCTSYKLVSGTSTTTFSASELYGVYSPSSATPYLQIAAGNGCSPSSATQIYGYYVSRNF